MRQFLEGVRLRKLAFLSSPTQASSAPRRSTAPRDSARAAAVLAIEAEPAPLPPPPTTIEPHVVYRATMGRRFGRVAVDLGFLKERQVTDLLALQQQARLKGQQRQLGELAVEKGLMTRQRIDEIVVAQSVRIHVDALHAGSPPFLTWIEDLKRRGARPEIIRVSAKDLLEHRERFGSAGDGNPDDALLDVLADAKMLFSDAAAIGANDLCIFVRERDAEVQIRVRGDYRVANGWSMNRAAGEALVRAIYTGLATVKPNSYNELEFQNAQIKGSTGLPGTGLSSVRLIRGPMYPSESKCSFMIARLQYNPDVKATVSESLRPLDLVTPWAPPGALKLDGFTPLQYELAEQLIYKPTGVVLVTGPTGSGKTTSLFEMMKHQARLFPTSRQITIEDPPEYPQPWAITLAAEGGNFQEMIRYSLRMDPDIILLGEIRYAEEGVAAIQAAMTGHFVWSTLHVLDLYESIGRLETLDQTLLSPRITCNPKLIVGLVAQRVVQILCPHCSVTFSEGQNAVPKYLRNRIASWGELSSVRVRGKGCSHCQGQTVIGRTAVAEIVVTDEEFMTNYRTQGEAFARRTHRAKAGSDKSMLRNAMDLVFSGKVDPIDVHRGVADIVMEAEDL